MTIKELKEKLDMFPEDAVVYIPCESYSCIPHAICRADAITDFLPTETDTDGPRIMIY